MLFIENLFFIFTCFRFRLTQFIYEMNHMNCFFKKSASQLIVPSTFRIDCSIQRIFSSFFSLYLSCIIQENKRKIYIVSHKLGYSLSHKVAVLYSLYDKCNEMFNRNITMPILRSIWRLCRFDLYNFDEKKHFDYVQTYSAKIYTHLEHFLTLSIGIDSIEQIFITLLNFCDKLTHSQLCVSDLFLRLSILSPISEIKRTFSRPFRSI